MPAYIHELCERLDRFLRHRIGVVGVRRQIIDVEPVVSGVFQQFGSTASGHAPFRCGDPLFLSIVEYGLLNLFVRHLMRGFVAEHAG